MPQESGFDSANFQSFLNRVAPNKIIDETYFSPIKEATPPADGTSTFVLKGASADGQRDYLAEAIERTSRASVAQAEVKAPSAAAPDKSSRSTDIGLNPDSTDIGLTVDITAATAAAQSRSLLAQEALLAKPSEMRKMFRESLVDLDLNHDKLLDMSEIDSGLRSPKTDSRQNFLTILKKGYNEFRMTSKNDEFELGVNEYSFEVIEKAMNRNIDSDPIYGRRAVDKIGSDFMKGLSAGVVAAKAADKKTALLVAGGGAILSVGIGQAFEWVWHATTGNNGDYDRAQDKYKAFVAHYRELKDAVPATNSPAPFFKW